MKNNRKRLTVARARCAKCNRILGGGGPCGIPSRFCSEACKQKDACDKLTQEAQRLGMYDQP